MLYEMEWNLDETSTFNREFHSMVSKTFNFKIYRVDNYQKSFIFLLSS